MYLLGGMQIKLAEITQKLTISEHLFQTDGVGDAEWLPDLSELDILTVEPVVHDGGEGPERGVGRGRHERGRRRHRGRSDTRWGL